MSHARRSRRRHLGGSKISISVRIETLQVETVRVLSPAEADLASGVRPLISRGYGLARRCAVAMKEMAKFTCAVRVAVSHARRYCSSSVDVHRPDHHPAIYAKAVVKNATVSDSHEALTCIASRFVYRETCVPQTALSQATIDVKGSHRQQARSQRARLEASPAERNLSCSAEIVELGRDTDRGVRPATVCV